MRNLLRWISVPAISRCINACINTMYIVCDAYRYVGVVADMCRVTTLTETPHLERRFGSGLFFS
jgi:hypothetical protein